MKEILDYLSKTYEPRAILLYGSYAVGTQTAESDFDALILTENHVKKYDNSSINGTVLDVFLYPTDVFEKSFEPYDFLQIFDGIILFDETNTLKKAQNDILLWMKRHAEKPQEEIFHALEWCEKMLRRTKRNDAEGHFRHHLLLTESLSIYSDIRKIYYLGPKKILSQMEKDDPPSFLLYEKALSDFREDTLTAWISHLTKLNNMQSQ